MRVHLARRHGVGADFFDAVEAEADALGERMRAFCRAMPRPARSGMFSQVYAEPSPTVERQREEFLAYHASFADRRAEPCRPRWQGAQRRACVPRWSATPRCWSWARTSAGSAASSHHTDGLQQKDFGEQRVLDTPLSESRDHRRRDRTRGARVRPVCEIQFDGFVFPGYDQTCPSWRSCGTGRRAGVRPVVVRIPYGGGIGAVEHHSESPESLFAHVAGLKVVTCSTRPARTG
ncbi:hypothetical protein [Pseudonocardia sp. ICBG601]|uniref:hypothetical protein n=1 Tax=Pseudonocardia sp. ICBG601 TaxID=2846759 RepID=UPI001CF617A2|nr:hypothetical protein [Pseudonocardia sp. ICBG601]